MNNSPQPPPDHPNLLFWFLLTWALMIIALVWGFSKYKVEPEKIDLSSKGYYLESRFYNGRNEVQNELQITKGAYLPAQAPPFIVEGKTLTTLTNRKEVSIDDIIPCESNGDPKACNKEFGCGAGMGLCGFIQKTWNSTLDKMKEANTYLPERCWQKVYLPASKERTEMIFDAECNRLAGKWLLENEGSYHWGTAETNWGSWKCWSK